MKPKTLNRFRKTSLIILRESEIFMGPSIEENRYDATKDTIIDYYLYDLLI